MPAQTLFGVAVPDAAVRVVIRPVLGRGPSLPLYEARLDEGVLSDTDVVTAASKNQAFWDYVDAQIKKKRIAQGDADCEWKLRLQFFNSLGVEESVTTEGAFEFYRSASAAAQSDASPEARSFERGMLLIERLTISAEKTNKCIAESAAHALGEMVKAATDAIAKAAAAGAAAVAEASKQTEVVSRLTDALHKEALDLKEGIFELQTERAKGPAKAPKSMVEEIKEVVDVGRTLVSMADTFGGASEAAKPSPGSPPTPPPPAGG